MCVHGNYIKWEATSLPDRSINELFPLVVRTDLGYISLLIGPTGIGAAVLVFRFLFRWF